MKKLFFLIAITTAILISCNDPKDPPDDGIPQQDTTQVKVDTTSKQEAPKQ